MKHRDELFGYPIPFPAKTLYEELEIDLGEVDDDVRSAKAEVTNRLLAEKNALVQELEKVYTSVEGLREASAGLAEIQERGEEAEPQARELRKRLADLEQEAQRHDPEFREKRRRTAELELRIHAINGKSLDKPEVRRSYDRAHPPLALLELADGTNDAFVEGKTALFLLRRELSRFLAERGETVFHPSDLTREDFSSDFQPNLFLDGPEHE
jgi:DNA repair exonuclease SbcCD ATPase subunit